MASPRPTITRRALLGAAVILPLAGCAQDKPAATRSSADAAPSATPTASRTVSASSTVTLETVRAELVELEQRFDAILGVYATGTDTDTTIAHRADERFAFCSTFKGWAAAAVLHRNPLSYLDTRKAQYGEADLMNSSTSFTRQHVSTGMTLREACREAILHSDGTAGNLLLRELGGPKELTEYLRSLGDTVTQVDRFEPALAEDTPGDLRDTTTPRAIGIDYRKIVLGDALPPPDKREFLVGLLESTLTGKGRIRAGLPQGWRLAHKTGTGASYGTCNDIGIAWPPNSAAPLVISIMSRKTGKAKEAEALLAEATKHVVTALTR